MLKLIGTTAMTLVLASGLAFAQTTAPSAAPGAAPGTNAPATGHPATPGGAGTTQGATTSGSGSMGSTGAARSGAYLAEQSANHWLASNYMGKTVYGPNNEKVGDVNDILIDKAGTTTAIVVGVGGFLGMGEKNVAVPFSDVQMTTRDGKNELHMNVTRNDLEKAPAFKINRNRS